MLFYPAATLVSVGKWNGILLPLILMVLGWKWKIFENFWCMRFLLVYYFYFQGIEGILLMCFDEKCFWISSLIWPLCFSGISLFVFVVVFLDWGFLIYSSKVHFFRPWQAKFRFAFVHLLISSFNGLFLRMTIYHGRASSMKVFLSDSL